MSKFFWKSKYSIPFNLIFIIFTFYFCTQFNFAEEILAYKSWGAGVPSGTYMTAFATCRPWWFLYEPEAIQEKSSGGIKSIVKIDRKDILTKNQLVLPQRSIGYDVVCGAIIALRSLFSNKIIYDFSLIIRLQQYFLVISLAIAPLVFYFVHKDFHQIKTFTIFNLTSVFLLAIHPNKNKLLVQGIIDSALANPLAILSVFGFFILIRSADLQSKRKIFNILFCSLFLSYCTLVRGEFLFIFLFVYLYLFITSWKNRREWKGLLISLVFLFLFPVTYGVINKSIFGHFVPLRMQSGQNLYEPIGQYPNSYGIEYDDGKIETYLKKNGIEYISFEADEFLTQKYFEILKNNPKLFIANFYKRLNYFSSEFSFFIINLWTLPFILCGIIFYSIKDIRFKFVAIPLVIAIGYLIFFGWTNSLLRLVAPVHFLINIFICYFVIYFLVHRSQKVIEQSTN